MSVKNGEVLDIIGIDNAMMFFDMMDSKCPSEMNLTGKGCYYNGDDGMCFRCWEYALKQANGGESNV